MKYTSHFLLHVSALLIFLPFLKAQDYEEIRNWNISCFPKDTCSLPREMDDPNVYNCDCSSLCVLYDTCCIDSQFLNNSIKYNTSASCRQSGISSENIFLIDTCSTNYNGPKSIQRMCEQTTKNWSDPFSNVPVTNKNNFMTYKSIYCAICNGQNVTELTVWQVLVDCSSLSEYMDDCTDNKDFILENMEYIDEKGLWGLWARDSKSGWKFKQLRLNYKVPPEIEDYVHKCRPDLISRCPTTWKNERIKRLCQVYMAAVYFNNTGFRNVHCAICNGVANFTNLSCQGLAPSEFNTMRMSFGVLLDVSLNDGENVGKVNKELNTKCK